MPSATPADLALIVGRSQKRVRDVLRELYGTLPDGVTRWELSDEQVEATLAILRGGDGPTLDWVLEVGDVVTRRTVHAAYGGQEQSGIVTPRSIRDILIFTDPISSVRYGYDKFEGLDEDGSYWYTGQGQRGEQTFRLGNLALRDAAAGGRTIRLFRTAGTAATYVGAFTNGAPTFRFETIPDVDKVPRGSSSSSFP